MGGEVVRVSWEVCVERVVISADWLPEPETLEIRYRRHKVTPYGLIPLTDDEWADGQWSEVTRFNAPAGERHYVRVELGDA